MKKLYLWFFTLVCLLPNLAWAQGRVVSGKVTSADDGETMPGVNVTVKGIGGVGTVTDFEGKFRLNLPAEAKTLVFSFVGMRTREVEIGNQTDISVSLQPDSRELREVVVTAFGVERSKQEVSYAVQEIKGEEVAETLRPNVVNTLQGRIAGVNVGLTGGTPGASSQIVIRGATSMDGNNQPLFVIDGVPVDNTTLREGLLFNDASNRNNDYTNRIADLNPNDIESITVLKGPSAAALYGVDAAAGAIVITTKQGKKGAVKVDYSANGQWERITRFPERQSRYGFTAITQGSLTSTNGASAPNVVIGAWGAEIPAGTPIYDNMRSLFQWGFNQTHNVNVSGGNDYFTYNASGSVFSQKGSIPNTNFDRKTFRINTNAKLSNKLRFVNSVQYTNSFAKRPPATKGGGSAYNLGLLWPFTRDINNTERDDGTIIGIADPNNDGQPDDTFDNPLFNLQNNVVQDRTDRMLLNSSLVYDPFKWLNITGRVGYDNAYTYGLTVYDPRSWARFPGRNIARQVGGVFSEYESKNRLLNSFFLLTAKHKIGDLNGTLTLGNYTEDRALRVDSRYGENMADPSLWSISSTALATRESVTRGENRRLVALFGELKLDYKNFAYLSITGRNDWSSTMPLQSRSYFYPSISGNLVVSELLNIENTGTFSYAKVRASWAAVGKDARPHRFFPALQEFTRTGGGYNVGFFGANPNLVPERTTSFEVGADLKFFNNRLGLDVTYYRMSSRNQIVEPRLSYASGYILQIVNSGEVENRGVEVMINASPVRNAGGFNWNLIANFAMNRNKVLSLPNGYTEFYLSDTWLAGGARAGYLEGQSIMTITGNTQRRDANGNLIIASTGTAAGYPIRENTYTLIGDRQPLFNLGLTNSLSYKNFALNFLWDLRYGGDIFNATDWSLTNAGLSMRTANRGERVVFQGVLPDGTPNTREVELAQAYYSTFGGASAPGLIEELFVEKNIKALRLRDITFSYTVPKERFQGSKFMKSLAVTATGTNLLLFSNYTGADPDVNGLNASARGSGAMGFDFYSVPAPVAFALGLRAGF